MEERIGLITCYDDSGAERVIETTRLDSYLRKIGVNRKEKLKSELFSRLQGSGNRSYWFMNYNYRDFTEAELTREYYMPVCGVKEQPEGRMVNYVEWLTFSEVELSGDGFNNAVFSVDYVDRHESVYKNEDELRKIVAFRNKSTGRGIDSRQLENVCRIMHAIWDTQMYNPMARVVILLDDPEKESLELLRQIYLLMPCSLRLQMGFMTNVSATDLTIIGSKGGLPIYITTASPSDWITISKYSYPFPVFPIDVSKLNTYEFSQEKLDVLKRLAEEIDPQISVRLDYVEKKVLEEHNTSASSFRYYAEVLEKFYSGAAFWWYKKRIDSVEELFSLYKDQSELMRNDEYHKEALRVFATSQYPSSDLAFNITEIINNEKYPNRKRLLNFLSNDMNMGKQISSIEALRDKLMTEKNQELKDTKIQLEAQFSKTLSIERSKHESDISDLELKHDTELTELKTAHQQALETVENEYQNIIRQTKESYQNSIQTAETKYKESIQIIEDNNRQLNEQLNENEKKYESLKDKLDEKKKENGGLQNDIKRLMAENGSLVTENEVLSKKLKLAANESGTLRKLLRIEKANKKLKIAFVVALLLVVVFVPLTIVSFRQNGKLKDDFKMAQSEVTDLKKRIAELENNDGSQIEDEEGSQEVLVTAGETGNADGVNNNAESTKEDSKKPEEQENKENNVVTQTVKDDQDSSKDSALSITEEEVKGWEINDAVELIKTVNKAIQFEDVESNSNALFFHVKFSESEDGEDFSDKTAQYVGTYVDDSSADKNGNDNAYNYKWREYSGLEGGDGLSGRDDKGTQYFLHIAFADSKDGTENFSESEIGDRKYIGYYVDKEMYTTDEDPSQYSEWKEIPKK